MSTVGINTGWTGDKVISISKLILATQNFLTTCILPNLYKIFVFHSKTNRPFHPVCAKHIIHSEYQQTNQTTLQSPLAYKAHSSKLFSVKG